MLIASKSYFRRSMVLILLEERLRLADIIIFDTELVFLR